MFLSEAISPAIVMISCAWVTWSVQVTWGTIRLTLEAAPTWIFHNTKTVFTDSLKHFPLDAYYIISQLCLDDLPSCVWISKRVYSMQVAAQLGKCAGNWWLNIHYNEMSRNRWFLNCKDKMLCFGNNNCRILHSDKSSTKLTPCCCVWHLACNGLEDPGWWGKEVPWSR